MDPSRRWGDGDGGLPMKDILKIIAAILVIIVVWKIVKGLIGLLVGLVVAGLIVYGAVKLVESAAQKRLK
jgi:Co/Zn/Cd efflux system component